MSTQISRHGQYFEVAFFALASKRSKRFPKLMNSTPSRTGSQRFLQQIGFAWRSCLAAQGA
jgi:hypothetical protein